jgi:uncharacterized protein (UPF0303 family)
MSLESDLQLVVEQERELVFDRFDEDVAFSVGSRARDLAKTMDKGVAIGVYLWDRTLFYAATAGATLGNTGWIQRKLNTVKIMHKSTYRLVLERGDKPRLFDDAWGLDPQHYVIAGGAFPIVVKGIGIVGAVCTSGLHERDDHNLSVAAICAVQGRDAARWSLSPA